ncbi:MAG: hypothetical protein EP338_12860 [Bacteroidetes bacterium]|nr:MAG: hypothetical protein EP338_12860 [Bacteroidota bacterium]
MRYIWIIAFFNSLAFGQLNHQLDLHALDSVKRIVPDYRNNLLEYADSSFLKQNGNFSYTILPEAMAAGEKDRISLQGGVFLVNRWKTTSNKLQVISSLRAGYHQGSILPYRSQLKTQAFFEEEIGDDQRLYQDLRARIIFTPNRFLRFHGGLDQHFIGQGERSLLLGNQGVPGPFVQLEAKVWKFEYQFIQKIHREGIPGHFVPKGSSTHFLNFRHKQIFSMGIFETVTHIIKDSIYNRGFDPEYLNPLIFYRPQEYSLGSSDNVIMGLNMQLKLKRSMIYSQFVLDEFLLSQIVNRSRWWANKYGVQIGYKWARTYGDKEFFVRSELNLTRPYTYSHLNNMLNYGNQGNPVAHPLGSNFVESYTEFLFKKGKWQNHTWIQLYMKGIEPEGADTNNISYGGDLYESYLNYSQEFGVLIGNGQKVHQFQLGNRSSYFIWKENLEFFVEPRLIIQRTLGNNHASMWITMGIQARLAARERNY